MTIGNYCLAGIDNIMYQYLKVLAIYIVPSFNELCLVKEVRVDIARTVTS